MRLKSLNWCSTETRQAAYAMMLQNLTGIRAKAGAVVVARRSGEPVCTHA